MLLNNSVVMVTGGCGFIGSHLVKKLSAIGAKKILVIDSLRYGDRSNIGLSGSDSIDSNVAVISFTLGKDPPEVLRMHLEGVEYLFHLAAEKHNQSKENSNDVVETNIKGTNTLFSLAKRAGVKKVLFTSSLYSYGRMCGPSFAETDSPLPTTIYGISKLCGERLLAHYTEDGTMSGNVLRYFFVYGPRQFAGQGYKSVILKNFERLLAGEPPIIFGDGNQALDYIFVDDVVEATVAAMESSIHGEAFNVGSGMPTSINMLTNEMLRVAASSVEPRFESPDWTAGSCRVAQTDKIRRVLGWTPRVGLEEGLRNTWNWMKKERSP